MKSRSSDIILCQKDKLAVCGTAGTLGAAPWEDPEFEVWAVAQCLTYPAFKRADLLFELHDRSYWDDKGVLKRLNAWEGPLYMQQHYREVPRSIRFPIEVLQGYRRYHTTSITYMLAWALHSFLTVGKPVHVALFGIFMEAREEYTEQRPACEYWLGRMEGAGIDISIIGGAILGNRGLYAYENYDPLCFKLRTRIDGLKKGEQVRAEQRDEAEGLRREQIGAIKELEQWLRSAQRGELLRTSSTGVKPAGT